MSTSPDHLHYLRLALNEARKSPPKSTNFCVGACLVSPSISAQPLVTGFTLECEGNTHAEQCCFIKLAYALNPPSSSVQSSEGIKFPEATVGPHLPADTILYTTMEPCNKRSPGNTPCTERILAVRREDESPAIKTVVVGVSEPDTFVGVNEGKRKLQDAGIEVVHVSGLEDEILRVAKAGHVEE
ncbi:hypothetical protein AC579_5868 [Lecanosticta acicola]|uniref:CMP/dCMP-type deaminase domain-containing protein n=1 Tax=Lecanosticta acicola TaxID=111012 RepID=A0AAI8YU90_9PEZI|nr:hypothetical protein AC579_5868 [Lecanosticta acicola]